MVVGDLHEPFSSDAVVKWIHEFIFTKQPGLVIQVGDLYDRFSQSRFPKRSSFITPEAELELGRERAVKFWAEVARAAPAAKRVQLYGNHDDRVLKRVLEVMPEMFEFVKPSVRGLHEFDGVETIHDSKDEYLHNDIVFMHGWQSRIGAHADEHRMNTVHGHTHHGGTWFRNDVRGALWELDAGCAVDLKHEVFDYRISKKFYGVTNGLGYIDEHGPRFILYPGSR